MFKEVSGKKSILLLLAEDDKHKYAGKVNAFAEKFYNSPPLEKILSLACRPSLFGSIHISGYQQGEGVYL